MKNLFTYCTFLMALLCGTQTLQAQPTGPKAPNFTLQDVNGTTHDLYTYLGQGKIVVLDFFATWCGPCINSLPGLDDLYQTHGPSGDNTMVLLSLEMDPSTTNENAFISQYNVPNPVFDNGHTINNDYNIGAYPTFIVVCPHDSSFDTRVGSIGGDYHLLDPQFDACSDNTNDAKVTAATNINIDFCPGVGEVPGASVTFRNLGSDDLTSLDIVTLVDGNMTNSYSWTGLLPRLDYETVYLSQITGLTDMDHSIRVEASNPNGWADENPDNNGMDGTLRLGHYSSNLVTLNIKTDLWGAETTWKMQTSSGTTVAAGGPYSNGDSTTVHTHQLDLDPGDCYQFTIFDLYSDGICCTAGNGYFEIMDDNTGQALFRGSDFKQRDIRRIDVNTVGIEEMTEVQGLKVYPNPSRGQFQVDFDLESAETVDFEVLNLNGSRVFETRTGQLPSGFHQQTLELSALPAGMYLLQVVAGEQVSVRKLVVMD